MSKKPNFAQLLKDAVEGEGVISKAYSIFHNYSVTNQLLAYFGCIEQGVRPSPIATYKKWAELGRQVKRGSKAISLYLPVVIKEEKEDKQGNKVKVEKRIFILRPNWFALEQTEGDESTLSNEVTVPEWNAELALQNLGITVEAYDSVNGNSQGYAKPDSNIIAINPVAQFPHKTRFHELAHCLLHKNNGEGVFAHGDSLPRDIKEVEAESVAYILLNLLNIKTGQVESRGYIQHWLQGATIEDQSAKRIFGAVEKILKAGQPEKQEK